MAKEQKISDEDWSTCVDISRRMCEHLVKVDFAYREFDPFHETSDYYARADHQYKKLIGILCSKLDRDPAELSNLRKPGVKDVLPTNMWLE